MALNDNEVLLHKHVQRMFNSLSREFYRLPSLGTWEYSPMLESLKKMILALIDSIDEQRQRLERMDVDPSFYIERKQECRLLLEKIETCFRAVDEDLKRRLSGK